MGQCLFKRWKQNMVNRYLLSTSAKEDLNNIFSYISKELKNVESALNLINRFEEKFESLLSFPSAYPIIQEINLERNDLRKCSIENYVIIYLVNIKLDRIEIVRVIYQRVDYLTDI